MTDHTKDAPPDVPASPLPGSGEGGAPSTTSSGPEEQPAAEGGGQNNEHILPVPRGAGASGTTAPRSGWRGPPGSQGRPRGVKKGEGKPTHNPSQVHWWYDRLADWMIGNPDKSMKDAAAELGRSYGWILQLKNSDTFQRYWRERSGLASAEFVGGIKSKAFAASEAALDLLNDKLERMPETFTTSGLLEVVDTTMKRFAPEPLRPQSAVQVNIGLVSPGELQAARERMRSRGHEVIEAEEDSSGGWSDG